MMVRRCGEGWNKRMSNVQKYGLMGLLFVLLCLLTWAMAVGFGILQQDAAQTASQTEEGVRYLQSLEGESVAQVEERIQERESQRRQEQIQSGTMDTSDIWAQLKDAVIMGDSRAVGFYYFDFLDHSRVLATGGATIADIAGQIDTLKALNPPQIFLCYGLNDLSIGYWHSTAEYLPALDEAIQALQAALPNATVFVSSILPARDPAFQQREVWRQIPDYNVAIQAFCAEKGYHYIDNSQICQEYADLWQYDGIHVKPEFYPYWGENLVQAMALAGA